jgi:hypothetical protein
VKKLYLYLTCLALLFLVIYRFFLKKAELPDASGNPWEIAIIIDDSIWDTNAGDYLKNVFQANLEGVTQTEPLFDLINLETFAIPSYSHGNILKVTISAETSEPELFIQYNKYANSQIFCELTAPNIDSLGAFLLRNEEKLVAVFLKAGLENTIKNYKQQQDFQLSNRVIKNLGFSVPIPKGYRTLTDSGQFLFFLKDTLDNQLGIMMYTSHYKDSTSLKLSALFTLRDSMINRFVNDDYFDGIMKVDKKFNKVIKDFRYKKMIARQIKGRWYIAGRKNKKGSFISLHLLDLKKARIITLDGFVYAPKSFQRNYLRSLESIMYGIDFEKK